MKRVVVQAKGQQAVILGSDGSFHKVANKGYQVGQELTSGERVRPLFKLKAAAAAAAVFLALTGGSALAYYTPASYVSVDINPSIEFQLNIFSRVISVTGINEDGRELLKNIKTSSNLGQNIKAIVREAAAEGYLTANGGNAMVITVTGNGDSGDGSDKAADAKEADAKKQAEEELKETGTPGDVVVERVGYDRVQEARKLGTTPGKLNLVQKYIASAGSSAQVDINAWLKKPVKDIMKAIKDNRKAAKAGLPSPTATAKPDATVTPIGKVDTTATAIATPVASATPAPTASLANHGNNGKGNDDTAKPTKTAKTAKPTKTPKPTVTPHESKDNNGKGNGSGSGNNK
jgi:hypothetical protein